MGPGSHCKPSVFRSIPNALALRSSLPGLFAPCARGGALRLSFSRQKERRAKKRAPPQAPAVACARNSPNPPCGFWLRQARVAVVLPDAVCIFLVCFCCVGWHGYTPLWCGLLEARRKTRTPCSDSLRRSGSGRKGVRPFSGGHFAYLQFTEVLVF